MLKRSIFTLLFFIIHEFAFAQLWQYISPNPFPEIIKASIPDSMHVRAYGYDGGGVFHSSNDAGVTWTKSQLPLNHIMDIKFIDANEGWIADSTQLLHSIDGGQSFQQIALPTLGYISAFNFFNSLQGYVLLNTSLGDSLIITNDAGQSWTAHDLGVHLQRYMYFASPLTGWMIAGYDSSISKTVDGGMTWIKQPFSYYVAPYNNEYKSPMYFLDSLQGWICTQNSVIHTIDGGASWSVLVQTNFGSIAFKDSLNGILHNSGKLYVTHNSGTTWTLTNIPYNYFTNVGDVLQVADGYFVLTGRGYIDRSIDGDNWQALAINTFHFTLGAELDNMSVDMSFSSKQKGFFTGSIDASGHNSGVSNSTYITMDGGKTWTELLYHLTPDFQTVNDSLWFMLTYYYSQNTSQILKSNDNFQTSPQVIANFSWRVTCFHFIDSLHAIVAGDSIQYTNDGGNTWINSVYPNAQRFPSKMTFLNSQLGWMHGSNFIAQTLDGGLNWNTIYTHINQYPLIKKLKFLDPLNGFLILNNGFTTEFNLSHDGGVSWSPVILPDYCWDYHFNDVMHGWFATHSGIYYTSDGMNTFTLQENRFTENMAFYDSNHAYASSSRLLMHTDQTGILNSMDKQTLARGLKLFPNPTSKSFQVNAEKPILELFVYDVNGKIVEKTLGNGTANLTLIINVNTGIYFVKVVLEDESFVHAKLVVVD